MVTDFIDSAKQSILERLSSPLLGSLAISWCGWNWKFLMIVFSNAPITTTFDLINRYAFPDLISIFLNGIACPLLTALAYVFLYPYPARFVYEFTLRKQREMNQTKQRIAEETPLTLEESKKIRAEQTSIERRHNQEIQELTEEIERLKAAKDESTTELTIPIPVSHAEKLYHDLEPSQLKLLGLLDLQGGSIKKKTLLGANPDLTTRVEFDLGELQRLGLIEIKYKRDSRGESSQIVEFTHEGRRVLLRTKSDT